MKTFIKNTGKLRLAGLLLALFGVAALQAQTFSVGTLTPGKTIVITYDVDVNANACSPETAPPENLSNQAGSGL